MHFFYELTRRTGQTWQMESDLSLYIESLLPYQRCRHDSSLKSRLKIYLFGFWIAGVFLYMCLSLNTIFLFSVAQQYSRQAVNQTAFENWKHSPLHALITLINFKVSFSLLASQEQTQKQALDKELLLHRENRLDTRTRNETSRNVRIKLLLFLSLHLCLLRHSSCEN